MMMILRIMQKNTIEDSGGWFSAATMEEVRGFRVDVER